VLADLVEMKTYTVIACLLVTGCRLAERAADTALESAKAVYQDSEERQLRRALEQTRELGTRATTVVLYEVANEFDEDFASLKSNPRVAGYPIRRKRALNRQDVRGLIELLTSRPSYLPPNDNWTCIFAPHHVLQLQGGADTEVIVICVKCGDVDFHFHRSVTAKGLQSTSNDAIAAQLKSLI
jgi:hypothetical protein